MQNAPFSESNEVLINPPRSGQTSKYFANGAKAVTSIIVIGLLLLIIFVFGVPGCNIKTGETVAVRGSSPSMPQSGIVTLTTNWYEVRTPSGFRLSFTFLDKPKGTRWEVMVNKDPSRSVIMDPSKPGQMKDFGRDVVYNSFRIQPGQRETTGRLDLQFTPEP